MQKTLKKTPKKVLTLSQHESLAYHNQHENEQTLWKTARGILLSHSAIGHTTPRHTSKLKLTSAFMAKVVANLVITRLLLLSAKQPMIEYESEVGVAGAIGEGVGSAESSGI